MFYYKTSLNDAWETWERYASVEPLNVDGGKIELLPNRHKTIFLGKSPFDSCFLKIELATLYRTSKTAGIIKLESNTIYIPRYQPIKVPKAGARSRRKALRVVSYPKQSYKLRLVPVNGQSLGDVSRLSQQLNKYLIIDKNGN